MVLGGCLHMVLHVIVSTFVVILSHCWYFCGDFGSLWYCDATENGYYKRYSLVRVSNIELTNIDFYFVGFLICLFAMLGRYYLKNQLLAKFCFRLSSRLTG